MTGKRLSLVLEPKMVKMMSLIKKRRGINMTDSMLISSLIEEEYDKYHPEGTGSDSENQEEIRHLTIRLSEPVYNKCVFLLEMERKRGCASTLSSIMRFLLYQEYLKQTGQTDAITDIYGNKYD